MVCRLLVLLIACFELIAGSTANAQTKNKETRETHGHSLPAPPTSDSLHPSSAPVEVALEELTTEDTTGFARYTSGLCPALMLVRDLVDPLEPCWGKLKGRISAIYQATFPSERFPTGADGYFIFEGNFPREELKQCVVRAFNKPSPGIRDEGELLGFASPIGTVYAAWRGRFLIVGGKQAVSSALRPPAKKIVLRWRDLIALLPKNALVAQVSVEQRPNFQALVGAPSKDLIVSLDKLTASPPFFAGRVIVHYPTPEAAAKSANWIKSWSARGDLPLVIPPPANTMGLYKKMAKAIAELPLTQEGNRVQIDWNSDLLGGVENMNKVIELTSKRLDEASREHHE